MIHIRKATDHIVQEERELKKNEHEDVSDIEHRFLHRRTNTVSPLLQGILENLFFPRATSASRRLGRIQEVVQVAATPLTRQVAVVRGRGEADRFRRPSVEIRNVVREDLNVVRFQVVIVVNGVIVGGFGGAWVGVRDEVLIRQ